MKRALIIFAALLSVGCSNEKALIAKFASQEDDKYARHFVDLLREGRLDEADPMLDPAVATQAGAIGLNRLHQIVDHGQPIAFELVGANLTYVRPWSRRSSSRQTNLVYQLQFSDAWVLATIAVESSAAGRHILSASFQPGSDSPRVLNRFTFQHKSALHYAFLAMAILVPLFIVTTVIICLRSRPRHRWLWILFIIIGLGQFSLNWTTGAWDIAPLSFSLLGAAWFRASSYAPVILSFSIPLGAIVFLICRSRLLRKSEQPPLATGDPGSFAE